MPIASNIDYIPVMDEVISHWGITDDSLTLAEDGVAVSFDSFGDLRALLDTAKSQLQVRLNDLEGARVALEQARLVAGDRVAEFNRRIRADFPNNATFSRLPTVPNRSGGRDAFLDAMDDTLDLWSRVNALPPSPIFTAPLLLPGGLTRAQFQTLRTGLDTAFTNRGNAENAVSAQRITRNGLQDRAKSLMVTYRLKVEALYAPDSLQVITLPRLTPAPGSTPDPVALTAAWDPADLRAELSWTASDEPELAAYQVRAVPGPDYSTDDETLVASIPPNAPRTYQTAAGLALPGSAMSYKIYVRLTTGHEAGSSAKTVTRPG